MSASPDFIERWSQTWRTVESNPATPDLHNLVARDSRRLALMVGFEWLVVVGVLSWSVHFVLQRASLEGFLWISSLIVFFVAALAFNAWNRRGLRRAANRSTSEFIALSIDRCYARLLAARFARSLGLVESVFVLGWRFLRGPAGASRPDSPEDLAWLAAGLVVFNAAMFLWAHYYSRRVRQELERLKTMRNWLCRVP